MAIHPTAIVEDGARLGADIEIGPYCLVGAEVTLGDGVRLVSHAVVTGRTSIGAACEIFPFASIGHRPQDLKYRGEPSELVVGERNVIREHVTMNPGTEGGGLVTRVGNDCLFMVGAHVAHDSHIADRTILANNVLLAGHADIHDYAIISGGAAIHHFVTIGRYAFVGGNSGVVHDCPPFMISDGHPARVRSVNTIGLHRHHFPQDTLANLKQVCRLLYQRGEGNQARGIELALARFGHDEACREVLRVQKLTDAYLRPALRRANLQVETGVLATRVLFDGARATGVEYRQNGQTRTATARAEVILCAGALNTPQLLQLSGIGPGALLQDMGIDTRVDAPQVGRNLMDHLGIDHLYAANRPSLNQVLRPFWGKARVGLHYVLTRRGPLSMSLNQGGGFIRLDGGDGPPDLQLYFSPLSYSRAPVGQRPLMSPDPFPAFRLGFSPCKPTSAGYLQIASPDPAAAPVMHPGYLSTQADCRMMIAGSRLIRRLAGMPALQAVTDRELLPGPDCTEDDALLANARADAGTVFHQCGTARMGTDPAQSVVDPCLRVHGVAGLRIADASIFPTIPSGNTNAPAIMVGENAADILRKGAR